MCWGWGVIVKYFKACLCAPAAHPAATPADLPTELVSDILTHLPVKSLLRFRCVCKSWLSLIDSSDFVNSHLARNTTTKSNTYCVAITNGDPEHYHHYYEPYSPTDDDDAEDDDDSVVVHFDTIYARRNRKCAVRVLGSVNGIVCLIENFDFVVLWNPSTRERFELPCDVPLGSGFCFGYDSVRDDFKVVRLGRSDRRGRLGMFVDVFSLKSMSWTRVEDFPYHVRSRGWGGLFVCGAIHWFLKPAASPSPAQKPGEWEDKLIVSFNVHSEDSQLFTQPVYSDQITSMKLFALEGSLGVFYCYNHGSHVELWIMKEYGVKDSWTRLTTIDQCHYVRPLLYSKDGRRVLLEKNLERLVWYDLEKKKIRKSKIRGKPELYQKSFIYVESLIKIPGPNEVSSKNHENL